MKKWSMPNILELGADSQKLLDVLNKESPLPCVLIAASYLDATLASTLKKYFGEGNTANELLESGGALSDFSNRARISYCLGLISKSLYQNLRIVGEIRNLFAHKHLLLDFTDPGVIELVNKLKLPKIEGDNADQFIRERSKDSFDLFKFFIVIMSHTLLGVGRFIERKEIRPKDIWV